MSSKLSREDKIAIGQEYLAKRKRRGGVGNNQHMKNSNAIGSTAWLIGQKYGVSEKSVKLWARLALDQANFDKLAQQYFSLARGRQ